MNTSPIEPSLRHIMCRGRTNPPSRHVNPSQQEQYQKKILPWDLGWIELLGTVLDEQLCSQRRLLSVTTAWWYALSLLCFLVFYWFQLNNLWASSHNVFVFNWYIHLCYSITGWSVTFKVVTRRKLSIQTLLSQIANWWCVTGINIEKDIVHDIAHIWKSQFPNFFHSVKTADTPQCGNQSFIRTLTLLRQGTWHSPWNCRSPGPVTKQLHRWSLYITMSGSKVTLWAIQGVWRFSSERWRDPVSPGGLILSDWLTGWLVSTVVLIWIQFSRSKMNLYRYGHKYWHCSDTIRVESVSEGYRHTCPAVAWSRPHLQEDLSSLPIYNKKCTLWSSVSLSTNITDNQQQHTTPVSHTNQRLLSS